MQIGYKDKVTKIYLDTTPKTSSISDMKAAITKPDGSSFAAQPLTMAEQGDTGVYVGSFTPTVVGDHVINFSSTSQSLSNLSHVVQVIGASNDDLKTAIDAVPDAAAINAEADQAIADANLATAASITALETDIAGINTKVIKLETTNKFSVL